MKYYLFLSLSKNIFIMFGTFTMTMNPDPCMVLRYTCTMIVFVVQFYCIVATMKIKIINK